MGVIMKRKLNFNLHVSKMILKARFSLSLVKRYV